ncbi:sugar phosphate isomerase/epimerase family protein [Pelagicoccus sp. SDUM812002]|uniref:sugar phosphate isomerase/epimerase family protein n=1 Tax=Pelagicoccus sp. SDUM812002 TaxID=3041266 RepID=UPI00280FEED4|nr:sugar phosphate isomerase/epimerase family protein [Pelagicoccus sp. SDUM812002]MDQ8187917.1 sugar phosphate isomerase/epimerase [Pelagicoccus sp. SDUM812002]
MPSPNRRDFLKTSALFATATTLSKLTFAQNTRSTPKLNLFSKHLQFLGYQELAETAKSIGFDGIDLTVRPGGHVLPERVEQDLPKVVDACREQGLETPMMTTTVEDADDPLDQAVLITASQVGIDFYRMNWLRYEEDISMPDSLQLCRERIQKLDSLNQKLGIVGCYQNHAGTLVGASPWEVWQILQDASPEQFGAQYDIRHATVEGGRSWPNGLRLLNDRIKTIVIKDFKWVLEDGRTRLVNTPLGEGMVDFPNYFRRLKDAKIDAPISFHFEYELGGAESGLREISKSPEFVFEAMRRDIATFKRLWTEA